MFWKQQEKLSQKLVTRHNVCLYYIYGIIYQRKKQKNLILPSSQ